MKLSANLYIPGDSIIHTCDARVKLLLLLAYSVTLFLIRTWTGMFICLALCLACCLISRVRVSQLLALMIPLYVILAVTLLFNSFSFDIGSVGEYYGVGDVSPGVFDTWGPISLWGSFGFVPVGFARGCYFALRILVLVLASLVVSLTTTSSDITSALNTFLRPLQVLKVPTADIAMIISIALRFIPITAGELSKIYAAQWARGAKLDTGSVWNRIKSWQTIFIPLFVSLFRRADHLALAMEGRCYGMNPSRTDLNKRTMNMQAWSALVIGVVCCVCVSVFL